LSFDTGLVNRMDVRGDAGIYPCKLEF